MTEHITKKSILIQTFEVYFYASTWYLSSSLRYDLIVGPSGTRISGRIAGVSEPPRQLVNLHKFYTHTSPCFWVCTHVYVCVYILAMGLDPGELRQCFASCWAWEKDGSPFHSCLGLGPVCWGPPYPFYTPPATPLSVHPSTTTLLSPSHSGCSLLTFKSESPFLFLHKYISLFEH